jgi:hypothetical protein
VRTFIKLLLLNLLTCTAAFANDSTGTIAAGGIQFTQTPFIKMVSEDLTISKDKVKVDYLFKNLSEKPIATTVLFPLPLYQEDGPENDYNDVNSAAQVAKIAKDKKFPPSILNFSVVVDGKPVAYQVKIQAILDNGKDITDILTRAGIPLLPQLGQGSGLRSDYESLDKKDIEKYEADLEKWKDKAQQLGLLDKEGKARWKKQVTFYWPQVFPAGKTVTISHEYKPAVGGCFMENYGGPKEYYIHSIGSQLKELYNVELSKAENKAKFEDWISTNAKKHDQSHTSSNSLPISTFSFGNVGYILTTGANWAGPIEKFTLTLQYPANGAVVYMPFYSDTSAKIISTSGQLQILLNNFTPKQDLNIVFGSVYP